MYKFICWLDEPGKRLLRVVLFQYGIAIFLMVVLPNSPKFMWMFWFTLASSVAIVTILANVIDRSWQLILGLSISSFVEGLLIIPFALVVEFIGVGYFNVEGVWVLVVLVVATVVFMNLALFVAKQNYEKNGISITPPTS